MTKIYSANITIGMPHENPIVLTKVPCKKLPLIILFNDDFFIDRLINAAGNRWTDFKINKETRMPEIKISWIKYLSDVANEPIEEHGQTVA